MIRNVFDVATDFPQFEISHKNILFRDYYVDHFNGVAPIGPATNKKWFIDVDNLYDCLFVNGNHWVALDINLPAKKIYIFDSIPSLVRDDQMVLQCMFLRRMIPVLLSQEIDDEVHKKSYAMLEVRRVKVNVPLNEDPEDCGVFALKYIECLALGKPFDRLCDRNIPALRVKLPTELFDEVGEDYKHHIP
ncbi:hypothetical protein V5N11_009824 [Cardamine amara subsp. amara]|uniref:Ubiquitin-like protease family profile domain-containing protein n=1 Tax=Cardamine amara subsp. amara TaxID=228776 RepID=A0ABD1C7A8_CARAN